MFTFLFVALGIFPNHSLDSELMDVAFNSFIYEDSKGYTWISSSQGWNQYSGISCKVFDFNDLQELSGAWVQSNMFESHDKRMFTSTYNHLLTYHSKEQSFKSRKLTYLNDTLEAKYHISSIDTIKNILYFSADNNFFEVNYNTWKCKLIAEDVWSRRFQMSKEKNQIIGCPWAERSGIELFHFADGEWTKSNRLQEVTSDSKYIRPIISQAIPHGSHYMLVSDHGLIKWSPSDDSYDLFFYNMNDVAVNYAVMIGDDLLVSIDKHGLQKFDLDSLSYVKDPLIDHLNEELISDSPVELFYDSKEQLWLSHRGVGVQVFSLPNQRIELESKRYFDNHRIRKVLGYRDDMLAVATEDGRLNIFNGEYGNLRSYDYISMELRNPNIQDIAIDQDHTIWVADIYGLSYLVADSDNWVRLKNFEGSQLYYFNEGNYGELFISTSSGSYKLEPKDNSYLLEEVDGSSLIIKSYRQDNLLVSNYQSNVVVSRENHIDTLSEVGLVYDVGTSYAGDEYYLATDSGLYFFKNNGKIQKLVERIDQPILDLTVESNSIWFHTADNIYIHEFETNITRIVLTANDYQFVETGLIFLKDKIYVGTTKGILEIPKKIEGLPQVQSRLAINQVLKDGVHVDASLGEIVLEHDIKELKLNWELIDYNPLSTGEIYYQLIGYDTDLKKTKNPISYYNLRPGKYELHLSPVESNYVKEDTMHFALTVKSPFYDTALFRLLAAATLILIGFYINFLRSKAKLKEQQIELDKEKALSEQRATVSRDLHDELGSGLASIKYLSQAKSEIELSVAQQISTLSSELIASMRDLLWSLDESNETASKLAVKIRHTVAVLTNSSGINAKTQINLAAYEDLVFNALERRNLILILKEAIANVIKHSKASRLDIRFLINEAKIELLIIDNGSGFNLSSVSEGIGLSSIQKRSSQINATANISSNEKGTIVHVVLPRS